MIGRSSWRPLHGRRTCCYFAECLMFAECFVMICRVFTLRHSANRVFCRVQYVCRIFPRRHSTHSRFAEYSIECTRQTLRHSAYLLFPVVFMPSPSWCSRGPTPSHQCLRLWQAHSIPTVSGVMVQVFDIVLTTLAIVLTSLFDMAKSCSKVVTFLIVQQIYALFASSTKR